MLDLAELAVAAPVARGDDTFAGTTGPEEVPCGFAGPVPPLPGEMGHDVPDPLSGSPEPMMPRDSMHEHVLVNGAFGVDDVLRHGDEAGFVPDLVPLPRDRRSVMHRAIALDPGEIPSGRTGPSGTCSPKPRDPP